MPMHGRAQRPTLTYAQMYGSGYQEGMGIWSSFKKWVKGAAKKGNKYLKKTKLISKVGGIIGPMAAAAGQPGVGAAISAGSAFAKQHGYGTVLAGGAYKGKCKNISQTQHMALKQGLGKWLPSGGVSLAAAKPFYPGIKNISGAQVKALAAYRGRNLKGGGISLAMRKAGKAMRVNVKKATAAFNAGYKAGMKAYKGGAYGAGYSGMGLKLAGSGPYVGAGVVPYKKKRYRRKKPVIIYRM